MNKMLLTVSVLGLLAGCATVDDNFSDNRSFGQCVEVARNKKHIVYECPTDLEWVKTALAQKPDSKFKSLSGMDNIIVKSNKTFVEVDKESGKCPNNHYYRVMVKQPTNRMDYAKQTCGNQ